MGTGFKAYYIKLLKHFGPQNWWPAETDFEVIVGAILTQNTNWSNVEKAITNLKENGLMEPEKLLNVDIKLLAELIRPSGYYNIKAARLKSFMKWFNNKYRLDLNKLKSFISSKPIDQLREEILSVKGIGKETADSIILYALHQPSFVVDAYTYRIFNRHDLIPEFIEYDDLKEEVEGELPKDVDVYKEFHALLVQTAKNYCRKKEPECDECPLKVYLPRALEPSDDQRKGRGLP